MKKILVVLLLAILPCVSALTFDLQESYAQRETIIAHLIGPVVNPLSTDNIEFRRGHVAVPAEFDLKKLGEDYYLYLNAPASMNNYTLLLKDAVTLVNGQQTRVDVEQNFSTTNETAPYTLSPGLLLFTTPSLDMRITLNRDEPRDLTILNRPARLRPGDNRFTLSAYDTPPGFSDALIGDYTVPTYRTLPDTPTSSNTRSLLIASPERIEFTLIIGDRRPSSIIIRNRGEEPLERFVFIYNESALSLFPTEVDALEPNATFVLNITARAEGAIDELVRVQSGNETLLIPVKIAYIVAPSNLTNQTAAVAYYCEELNGRICLASETCSGSLVNARNGNCCIGSCIVPQAEGVSWGGWFVGAIILIILITVGARYYKTRKSGDGFKKKLADLEA